MLINVRGVALLVKDYLLQKLSLNLVDDNCEGIMGIELKPNKPIMRFRFIHAIYHELTPHMRTLLHCGHLITQIYFNSHPSKHLKRF